MNFYNNIPNEKTSASTDKTLDFFNTFYESPVELDNSSLTAIKGFFESKGFKSDASESVSIIIISQAKKDNLNPFDIIDTLKGLNDIELSAIVGEILNYNRF